MKDDLIEIFGSSLPPTRLPSSFEPSDENNELVWAADCIVQRIDRNLAEREAPLASRCSETRGGVYALLYAGRLVYIGSTDRLARRIADHQRTIRVSSILISNMKCRYAVCPHYVSLMAEKRLVEHYVPEWNGLGFGSKHANHVNQWKAKYIDANRWSVPTVSVRVCGVSMS